MTLSRVFSLVLCVFLLCAAVSAHAQTETDTTRSDGRPLALQDGGWGLQYKARSLNSLLSSFQGSLLSGRYHLSSREAVRVGVSVDISSRDSERTQSPSDGTLGERSTDQEGLFQGYGLFGQYLRYVEASEQIFVIAGVGPRVGFDRDTQDETTVESRSDGTGSVTERRDGETTTYRIGLEAAIGAEWFMHPNISLSVEYPLRFDYTHSEGETTRTVLKSGTVDQEIEKERESDQYSFGGQSVRVGVTFSFGP